MSNELRQSGIEVLGTVPWGTHFCQFYQTREDLLDILVPYFKAGLENNEFCMWITAEPLSAEEASRAMRRAMPDFANRLDKGQIEIIAHTEWYLKDGKFDQQRVLNGWVDKLNGALAAGYTGLRLTGNTFWLEKRDWQSFTDYEAAVNNVIGKYRMLALCTYSLAKCDAAEVIDVIRNHEFALIRKEGEWELIENAIHKQAKQALRESKSLLEAVFSSMNEAVVVVDTAGNLVNFNEAFARFCRFKDKEECLKSVSEFSKLIEAYNLDGKLLPVEEWAAVRALRGESGSDLEYIIKRTDTCETWISSNSFAPMRNVNGEIIGAVQTAHDITESKQMEDKMAHLASFPELNPLFVVETDSMGNANYANPAIMRLFPALIAMGAEHPYLAGIPESIRSGKTLKNTQTIREINIGKQYYQQVIMVTPDNQHVRIYGSDITERKKAEEGIRRAKEEWERTFESVPDLIAILDNHHQVVRANKAMAEKLGRAPEECVGLPCYKAVHGTDTPPAFCPHIMTLADRCEHTVEVHEDKLGGDFIVSTTPLIDSEGQMIGSVHVARDITERKRREEKIIKLTRLYAVLSQANEAIVRIGDAKSLCSEICRIVAEDGGFPLIWIGQVEKQHVVPLAWSGPAVDYLKDIKVEVQGELGRGPTGTCIRENRAVVNDDFATNTTVSPWRKAALSYGFRASAAFPLRHEGKAIGALTLYSLEPSTFDADQIRLLESLGSDISYALDSIGQEERRIQAEEVLRETRDYLDNLLNYANAPIIVWDPKFRITRFNKAFERLTGYNAKEVLSKKLDILFPAQTREESLNHIRRTASGERWEVIEIPILRTDGSVRTVLWNSATLYASDSKTIVATIAQGQDITERKQAEQELTKQAFMLANVSDAVMGIDLDHRINYWSPSAERMYGYSAAEAMGKTTLDLIKPDYVGERREDVLQRLMHTGYLEAEYVHETKDGRRLNIDLRSTLLRDDRGEPFGVISVNRDITERKRSEEVQHIGNMGSWEWNVITGELDWSDEVCLIFGLKSGQFEGTHEAFLNYVHPDDRKKLELAENEALHNHNKDKYSLEVRIVRPDGSIRVIRENAKVYHNPKGKPVQMIGTTQDITERKAVEERLKSLSRRLVDMQEEERRGIARELHDGLAQSLAIAKIWLDRGTKPSVDVGYIIAEARNVIQDVIDQVREMSLNLRPSMLDDMGLLPALQWHFEQVTSRTGVKINFKHSGLKLASSKEVPPEVRTAVYRIVQEALSNAIRHAEADQIDVTIRIRNNILRLLVEDHGKGFDIDAMPSVSSGLSTMQERAYICGGSLIVDSAPGLGTRISAEIPLLMKED